MIQLTLNLDLLMAHLQLSAAPSNIKHHKAGNPLRPIITCMGSQPLHNTSKFLTSILAPIQNHSGHSVSNSLQFSKETTDIDTQDDEIMVSFDFVSLFTAIPIDKTCNCIRKKLENGPSLHCRTRLDIDDIVSLLNFVLSNNYFVYKDKIYKQIHGCVMGSPVVASIPAWKKLKIQPLTQPLFLPDIGHDTLVSRDNGKLFIDVYRKPTHTDRYFDFHSHHDNNHKSTAATLIHRATNLPNSQTGRD